MSADEIATAFTDHYYSMRQTDQGGADQLAGLFNERSMMTFEGAPIQGSPAIVDKIRQLGPVRLVKKSQDVQPSADGQSIVIFVTGGCTLAGQENQIHFSEFFYLVPTGPGAYCVANNIFRLNYGM